MVCYLFNVLAHDVVPGYLCLSLNYNLIANKIPCIKQRLRKVDGPLICCKPFSLSLQPH